VAAGQSQRLYSGVGIFNWYYLSSPTQILRAPGAPLESRGLIYISELDSSWTPGAFYTCFYNHAHRLHLEKLLYIGLSRSSSGYFKPLLDPGGGFTSETAVRLQIYNGCMSVTVFQVRPPGYFVHVSITTPIVSALKNY
jgi:hypothetical protein